MFSTAASNESEDESEEDNELDSDAEGSDIDEAWQGLHLCTHDICMVWYRICIQVTVTISFRFYIYVEFKDMHALA